jgi:hypothetical protein
MLLIEFAGTTNSLEHTKDLLCSSFQDILWESNCQDPNLELLALLSWKELISGWDLWLF